MVPERGFSSQFKEAQNERTFVHLVVMRVAGELAMLIGAALGTTLSPSPAARVHGGSINESWRWESRQGPLFVKVAAAAQHPMFAAEAAGLEELRAAAAVRVPRVLGCGAGVAHSWLVLEWIEFGGADEAAEARLGTQLALQHRKVTGTFGWSQDNTIGSTPQINTRCQDWVSFWRERRLRYQLELAARNGHGARLARGGDRLLDRLGAFFADYRPAASLLHGDLWGGNWGADRDGGPVIFDPAVYYGDREADLAMTRLFGGYGPHFYAAYEAAWPLDAGAASRVRLYNLYHILNHLNLFGGGYLRQALDTVESLNAQLI
jgi:protein-ribulosamine 3-kinase